MQQRGVRGKEKYPPQTKEWQSQGQSQSQMTNSIVSNIYDELSVSLPWNGFRRNLASTILFKMSELSSTKNQTSVWQMTMLTLRVWGLTVPSEQKKTQKKEPHITQNNPPNKQKPQKIDPLSTLQKDYPFLIFWQAPLLTHKARTQNVPSPPSLSFESARAPPLSLSLYF